MVSLRPVERRSVPEEVAEQLVDGIVSGEFAAGEPLPSERDLAEVLGVSRPTVRAALTRVAAAGLVSTRQGGGSTVLDFRRNAGLALLPRLLVTDAGIDAAAIRDLATLRAMLGPQVAAQAAGASAHEEADAHLTRALAAVRDGSDHATRQRAALELWDVVVDRSGSVVFRLLYNQLRAAVEPLLDAVAAVLAAETDREELLAGLVDAIVAGEPDEARATATELLGLGRDALHALADTLAPSR